MAPLAPVLEAQANAPQQQPVEEAKVQKPGCIGNAWRSLSKNQRRMILVVSIIASILLAGGLSWGLGARNYNPSAVLAGQILVQVSLIVSVPMIFSAVLSCIDKASE
jgi:hypothetical protein